LEKNRQKRASLEEVLQHKWFKSDFGEIQKQRAEDTLDSKFSAFTVMEPNSKKATEDIRMLEKERKDQ